MASPGLAFLALALAGYALSPSDPASPGQRVESESFTEPAKLARCITPNINSTMPTSTATNSVWAAFRIASRRAPCSGG